MKRVFIACTLATLTMSSFAYDAQIEGGFTYLNHDDDFTKTDHQLDAKATFYFSPVQTKSAPLNEAAFLGNVSNLYGTYRYNFLESENYIDMFGAHNAIAKSERDIHSVVGGLEYFYQQFYVNGEIGYSQLQDQTIAHVNGGKEKYTHDVDVTTYRALVGFMPVSNLLLAAGVDGYTTDEDDQANLALKAKYVTSLGQSGQYLNVEAEGTFGDLDQFTLATDYYFNYAFSLGASYTLQDDNHSNIDFFSVRSKYFINQNLALGGEVGFGDDLQGVNINATYRF